MIASSIIPLSFSVGPVAVAGGIPLFVVLPFDCKGWMWSRAHVAKKCREITSPFFTHGDSSLAVVRKVLIVWVCATLNHVRPRCVLWRVSLAVLGEGLASGFSPQAPATGCFAPSEKLPTHALGVAAITPALPKSDAPLSAGLPSFGKNQKPSESLPDEVGFWHSVTKKLPDRKMRGNSNV